VKCGARQGPGAAPGSAVCGCSPSSRGPAVGWTTAARRIPMVAQRAWRRRFPTPLCMSMARGRPEGGRSPSPSDPCWAKRCRQVITVCGSSRPARRFRCWPSLGGQGDDQGLSNHFPNGTLVTSFDQAHPGPTETGTPGAHDAGCSMGWPWAVHTPRRCRQRRLGPRHSQRRPPAPRPSPWARLLPRCRQLPGQQGTGGAAGGQSHAPAGGRHRQQHQGAALQRADRPSPDLVRAIGLGASGSGG
jgi:hypothetical protein